MKEAEVIQLGHEATLHISKHLSIPHCEFYDTEELLGLIKEKDFELHEKLENFNRTCWKLYYFVHSLSKRELKKEDLDLLKLRGKEKEDVRRVLINFLESRNHKIKA